MLLLWRNWVLLLLSFDVFLCFQTFVRADVQQESLFYRSLLSDAYLGNWYLMNNKALPYEGFIQKNGRQWLQGESKPYTGWYAQQDNNKTARLLCSFFEGVREGPVAQWDSEGNLVLRGAYLIGKKHGVFTGWSNQGTRIFEKEYANGRLDGWNYFWYDNGQIRLRLLFESGKLVEATGWFANGKKCPHTKVEKGSGIIIHHVDGTTLPTGLSKELKTQRSEN